MRATLSDIPGGDAGTYATLARMAALARRDALDPLIRQAAAGAVRGMPGDFGTHHAMILRQWITARTTFLADPLYAEALFTPGWMIRHILTQGTVGVDCDDVATFAAAMGLSIGLRARFVIVGFSSPNAPYSHVWAELATAAGSPRWIPVDPTRPIRGLDRLPITRRDVVEV
jgi:hypothetical protein